MNLGVLHDALPILIAIFGLFVGVFMATKIKRFYGDLVLVMDFTLLSIVNLYVGAIYLLFAMGAIHGVEELSIFVRPVNLLQIILPALITWRMGVR